MSKTRIYAVSDVGNRVFLVEATSAAQAERHIAAKYVNDAEVAKPKVIADLMAKGVKVEDATATAAE